MTENADLDRAVRRFTDAEKALVDLRTEQGRLLDATAKFLAVDDELRGRTSSALEALEDARTRLRQQIETSQQIGRDASGLQQSLGTLTDELTALVKALKKVDSAALTSGLTDIRSSIVALDRTVKAEMATLRRNGSQQADILATVASSQVRVQHQLTASLVVCVASLIGVVILFVAS